MKMIYCMKPKFTYQDTGTWRSGKGNIFIYRSFCNCINLTRETLLQLIYEARLPTYKAYSGTKAPRSHLVIALGRRTIHPSIDSHRLIYHDFFFPDLLWLWLRNNKLISELMRSLSSFNFSLSAFTFARRLLPCSIEDIFSFSLPLAVSTAVGQ